MIDLPDDYDQQRARTAHRSEVAKLRAEVRELKKRIRLARKMLLKAAGPIITGTTAWRLLDARFKLPRRSR